MARTEATGTRAGGQSFPRRRGGCDRARYALGVDAPRPTAPEGRSFAWRVGALAAGLATLGAGVALVVWPRLLAWTVGGALGALGLLLVVSAFAARGR
jgi:hypothetical protein